MGREGGPSQAQEQPINKSQSTSAHLQLGRRHGPTFLEGYGSALHCMLPPCPFPFPPARPQATACLSTRPSLTACCCCWRSWGTQRRRPTPLSTWPLGWSRWRPTAATSCSGVGRQWHGQAAGLRVLAAGLVGGRFGGMLPACMPGGGVRPLAPPQQHPPHPPTSPTPRPPPHAALPPPPPPWPQAGAP